MIVFHHWDSDGRCAGFWCTHSAAITDGYGDKARCIEMNYNREFDLDLVKPNEQVFIVDYSIPPEEMTKLLEITKNVTWIDHHVSAIEKYKDYPHAINGIRVNGVAGCVLTYIYLHALTERGMNPTGIKFNESTKQDLITMVPMFTRLIGERDVWDWQHGEQTKNFFAGINCFDTRPESFLWKQLLGGATKWIEEKGVIVEEYRSQQRRELLDSWAYESEFEGYSCIVCNVDDSSELFDSLSKQYDLKVEWVFDGNAYNVSLYSDSIDVSKVAVKHGGGGHKGAAGFETKELPFKAIKK